MTHSCSVPGCGRSIPSRLLMCPGHWRAVPTDLQDKVYRAWDQYQTGHLRVTDLKAVQRQATEAVVAALGRQPQLPGMGDDAA